MTRCVFWGEEESPQYFQTRKNVPYPARNLSVFVVTLRVFCEQPTECITKILKLAFGMFRDPKRTVGRRMDQKWFDWPAIRIGHCLAPRQTSHA